MDVFFFFVCRNMVKLILFIFLVLQRGVLFAQVTDTQQTVIQLQNSKAVFDTGVYLVKIVEGKAQQFETKYSESIRRQIDKDWFIVNRKPALLSDASVSEHRLVNEKWKFSPLLLRLFSSLYPNQSYTFLLQFYTPDSLPKSIENKPSISILSGNQPTHTFQVRTSLLYLKEHILNDVGVDFIDIKTNLPKEEAVINDYDNSVNAVNLLMANYPAVTGHGLSVSVKENLFDTADIDFTGRYIHTNHESAFTTTHATTMATLIAGGGNSFHTGKGIAWESGLSSSDFSNPFPDSNTFYQQYGTTVQNHSYGTGIENYYGADAAAFDQSILENPKLVFVFSAGNSGTLTDSIGRYQGAPRFANLTGSFKQAKNIITVGSVDSFFRVLLASSKGPAYDGRIKPELVAYGNDGSSGAAAITSGTALAVQSAYRLYHHDSLPDNALVKAILLNSADDVFAEGPDYYSGYGNVNAYQAVKDISSGSFYAGVSRQNSIDSFRISIPNQIKKVKLMLVWNDAPAAANAYTALQNDLDLSLKKESNNQIWRPWTLNSSPDSASLLSPAKRGRDSLNVVEQITIMNPTPGNYSFYVTGQKLIRSSQTYYVCMETDTDDRFQFVSPTGTDKFPSPGIGIVRWQNTYNDNVTGNLSYSINKGITWTPIAGSVALSNRYIKWNYPDTSTQILLRMQVNNTMYFSDTFTVSIQLFVNTVLNCPDSSVVNWQSVPGIHTYRVFQLGSKYLQAYRNMNDTMISIKYPSSNYIGVAPVLSNGQTGINSYTVDITKQGAGCYISNFLADLTADNKAELTLTLGTIEGVDSVWFQRLNKTVWETVYRTQTIHDVTVQNLYSSLTNGANIFRAVVWVNGMTINSSEATILYFLTTDFLIKPNPLPQGHYLSILSSALVTGTLIIFDATGRKLLQQEVQNATNFINTSSLARGIYFLVVYDEEQAVYRGRLIVN